MTNDSGQAAKQMSAVRAVLAEWDAANLTLPGYENEPTSDSNYRQGFFAAAKIARDELRAALDVA